jgi:hypothetical protein
MFKKKELTAGYAIDSISFTAQDGDIKLKQTIILEAPNPLAMLQIIEDVLIAESPMNSMEILPDHRRTKAFSIDAIFDNENGFCWHTVKVSFINLEGKSYKVNILINLSEEEENKLQPVINEICKNELKEFGAYEFIVQYKKREDILRVFIASDLELYNIN